MEMRFSDISTRTDGVLSYIDRMLMEDDDTDDEENRILESSTDFQAKVRSFYELLDPLPATSKETDSVAVVTSRRKNNPHDELDAWTHVDGGCENFASYITDLREESKAQQQGRKSNDKDNKKEEVDIRFLLISCAQAVASYDYNELLKQIRPHSNQFGRHADQRVAHYFVRGLEAPADQRVKSCYHREFVVVEDYNKWLMMSWTGKTICGLSCWQTNNHNTC